MAAQDPGMINNKEFRVHITHIPTGEKVNFKGWVTGFSDNFQSQWTGTPVYGRMDDLYTFQKTSRRISLAFDTIAGGEAEAIENLSNLNKLTQFLYPVYSDSVAKNPGSPARNSQVLTAAPLLKLKWNGLASDAATGEALVGFLAGFIYQPVIDNGQFFVPTNKNIVYQQHSVQLEFTVLHTHLTGWTKKGNTVTFGGSDEIQNNYPHANESLATRGEVSRIQDIQKTAERGFGGDWSEQGITDLARQASQIEGGVERYRFDRDSAPPLSIVPGIVEAAAEDITE